MIQVPINIIPGTLLLLQEEKLSRMKKENK